MRCHFPDVRRYPLPSRSASRDRIAGGGLQRLHHGSRKILHHDRHRRGESRPRCSLTTHRQELAAPPELILLPLTSRHLQVPSSKEPPYEEFQRGSASRS